MAIVVVVLAGAWLGLVFFAARQPRTGGTAEPLPHGAGQLG